MAIPQADEQQRLLANLIGAMNRDRKPLPRFWYFPRSAKAVVVITGDDHGNGGTAGRFDQYAGEQPGRLLGGRLGVPAVHVVRLHRARPLTNAAGGAYNARASRSACTRQQQLRRLGRPASLADNYTTQLGDWQPNYPSVPPPATNRTHCIVWSDWATPADGRAANGIRLDTNYYYWPGSWVSDRPGLHDRLRHADAVRRQPDGAMIDVYQAATQMTDESGQSYPFTPTPCSTTRSARWATTVRSPRTCTPTARPTFESDQLHGLRAGPRRARRHRQADADLARRPQRLVVPASTWSGNTLSFTVNVGAGANGLTGMVPTTGTGGSTLSTLTRAGSPVAFTKTTIKGVEYAMFQATAGNYAATYTPPPPAVPAGLRSTVVQGASATTPTLFEARFAPLAAAAQDSAAPVISSVNARPLPDGTVEVTWGTDENADATLQFGQQPDNLADLHDDTSDVAHTVVATKLQPGSTYYYRVKSVDAAGNATQWPAATDPPATFVAAATGVADMTAEQFRTVSSQAGTSVQKDGLGEVSLAPAAAAEFNTASLPSDWDQQAEATGGQDTCCVAGTWCWTATGPVPRHSSGRASRWCSARLSPDRGRSGRASRPAPPPIRGPCSACGRHAVCRGLQQHGLQKSRSRTWSAANIATGLIGALPVSSRSSWTATRSGWRHQEIAASSMRLRARDTVGRPYSADDRLGAVVGWCRQRQPGVAGDGCPPDGHLGPADLSGRRTGRRDLAGQRSDR